MTATGKSWLRARARHIVFSSPLLYRVVVPVVSRYRERKQGRSGHERLYIELAQQRAAMDAERAFLMDLIARHEASLAQHEATIQALTAERDAALAERAAALAEHVDAPALSDTLEQGRSEVEQVVAGLDPPLAEEPPPKPERPPAEELIERIAALDDLTSRDMIELTAAVEAVIADPAADKIGIHREIAKALFARSPRLYSGDGLPAHLERYTYPPVISIALSSHCNAACFFCRDSDYKGTTVDFDNVFKLESAIRNARTIDLTGWGEPFFYPRFEDVVSYITSVNDMPHLIQVTSNGSFLSERWGKMLSGKLNRLIISINAASPETYAEQMLYKNKRFTFEGTIANIKAFQAEITAEDRKRIFLHMVANTGNFREIPQLVRVAHDLGVPVVNVGNYICAHEQHLDKTLWNAKEEYNAEIKAAKVLGQELGVIVYGREFFLAEKEVKGAENCMAPFEQFFIEMEGTTAPCCFMGAERMGNVYVDGFEAVWFSDTMNKLRADRFLPPCQVCTVFTPFDNKIAHMSAFLTTKQTDVVLGGGPKLGTRVSKKREKQPAA